MKPRDDQHFQRLREAMRNEPSDTPLGKAVARLRKPFCIGDGEHFHYDKLIVMLVAIREALHEIDPTIDPTVPPFLLDPAVIAKIIGIPLEALNYQGGQQAGVDPKAIRLVKELFALLETHRAPKKEEDLSRTEEKILQALGDKTLIGEEIAPLAGCDYNGQFKGTLARLVKREILGNKRPGYYRL